MQVVYECKGDDKKAIGVQATSYHNFIREIV